MNDFSFCFRRGFYKREVQILGRKKIEFVVTFKCGFTDELYVCEGVCVCMCVCVCVYRADINLSVDPLVPFPIL